MKTIAGAIVILSLLLGAASPAIATTCRLMHNQQICILEIKRSAKNFWEYRAAVSIDGVERPIEIYNCRDRLWTRNDKTVMAFDRDPAKVGELICQLFQR